MINTLPITPADYINFFRTLAEWHVNIEHSAGAADRFVVINEGMVNPFRGIDLGELISKQRSTLHVRKAGQDGADGQKLLMVLTEWASDMVDSNTRPAEAVDGAFLLLGRVQSKDWDARNNTLNLAYTTGREIMAWITEFCALNSAIMEIDTLQIDPIGPITTDNLYGYRFDFGLNIKRSLVYSNSNFAGNGPARVID